MISLEDINNKKEELKNIVELYKKEIEEMGWQFLKEEYGLNKGCVCNKNGKYCVLVGIDNLGKHFQTLNFRVIKKDGTIGKNTTWDYASSVKKEFNNYDEYKKELEDL